MSKDRPLRVAVIGRPNVGKSTLFNRLVGKRLALVDDTPGVTRDRRYGDARLGEMYLQVIDTAGLEDAKGEVLEARMRAQTEAAIAEADVCLFMIDARAGLTPVDNHFADLLRRAEGPVIPVANKCEGSAGEPGYLEAFSLGFGDPIPMSAEHGEGMSDLYTALKQVEERLGLDLPQPEETRRRGSSTPQADDPDEGEILELEEDPDAPPITDETDHSKPLRVAVIGRPNAGKSTMINKLLGEERLLTGPEAGITRDSIAVDWSFEGRALKLFDTAGLRRKSRVVEKLEKLSVADTLRAVRFAEVVIVLIDVTRALEKQDLALVDLVAREGRAIVLGLNKWDVVEDRGRVLRELHEQVDRLLPQIRGVKALPVSGERGTGLDALMAAALDAERVWNTRISTARLNEWLRFVTDHHPPPAVSGKRIKIRYMTQVKSRPPTFAAFTQRAEALPASYERYLINALREDFALWGIPIRLNFRKRKNPYASETRKKG